MKDDFVIIYLFEMNIQFTMRHILSYSTDLASNYEEEFHHVCQLVLWQFIFPILSQ